MKPTQACRPENLHYLKMLARQYPTVQAASTEIINLQAILNLPKGTEHFVSDVHGEYEAFLQMCIRDRSSPRLTVMPAPRCS